MFKYVFYLLLNFIHVSFEYKFWTIIVYGTFIFQLCAANIHMNKDAQPHKRLKKLAFSIYKFNMKLFAYLLFISVLVTRHTFNFLRKGIKMHICTTLSSKNIYINYFL